MHCHEGITCYLMYIINDNQQTHRSTKQRARRCVLYLSMNLSVNKKQETIDHRNGGDVELVYFYRSLQ